MSSTAKQQTYWCYECDMSIHLLITTTTGSPLCPHCESHHLELMDDPTPTSTTPTDTTSFFLDSFFLPLFNDINPLFSSSSDEEDEEGNTNPMFDLPTIKITASLLEGDPDDPVVVCGVCKDEFVMEVDDAKLLPCNHLFHPDCILPWLNSNHNSCPLCRFSVLPSATDSSSSSSSSIDNFLYPEVRNCTGNFTHQDDSSFPDVGALSNFLPSHF